MKEEAEEGWDYNTSSWQAVCAQSCLEITLVDALPLKPPGRLLASLVLLR